ncbi:uncharacterized protein LOC123886793 [Trifolium pratense]|uniref:uncharacterized protein LOC123886793 n=1 Tax=Trifolium pratense TaxID=57577 RepID=UPI001E6966E6|nr:uncharacterized protein LOC123886793 [Trifolium pratense]
MSAPGFAENFVFTANGGTATAKEKPPDMANTKQEKTKVSFRDMLTEGTQKVHVKEKVNLVETGLVTITYEGGNKLLPKVSLNESYFNDLCHPWKEALVIKVLGKRVGYQALKERLQKIWKLQGGFDMMNVDQGFYMVKCNLLADRERIMSQGPWMVFDHYLAVAQWSPEFAAPTAQVEKTLVWIRFPGLNLLFYDESFLLALASTIGTPVKVDTNTLNVERGRFARICVEIDLTKPVVGKVWIHGHWYKVQYEGLHMICATCGCYGHITRNCTKVPAVKTTTEKAHVHQEANGGGIMAAPAKDHMQQQPTPAAAIITEQISGIRIDDTQKQRDHEESGVDAIEVHGEWMVVTRKKRNNGAQNQGGNRGIQGKNKYPLNSNNSGGTRNNGKSGVVNVTNGRQVHQNVEVGSSKKGVQAKKRRFENVAQTSNDVGPPANGSREKQQGPNKIHQVNEAKLNGPSQTSGANKDSRTQSTFPRMNCESMQRGTIDNREIDGDGKTNKEGEYVQTQDDQDEDLEIVQETPMDGDLPHHNMCQ